MTKQQELYACLGLSEDTLNDKAQYIQMTRSGLPGDIIRKAAKTLDNRDVLVRVLGTTSGNLNRYYRRKTMDTQASEELLDTIHIYGEALRIFGDLELVKTWMKTPLTSLAGEAPQNLFDTFKGREWVSQTLRKIEFGEFS